MRCVSYTRATSCYKDDDRVAISIQEQNAHIRNFTRSKGMTVSKKYCDRTRDPESAAEFEKMRIDGQNGSFDFLVIDSIWQCGKDIYQIVRVLKDVFYPAGIGFAVVQENYYSADHTKEDVNAFLEELWHRYSSHQMGTRLKNNSGRYHLDTFGYRYNEKTDMLEIDEESAAVVREIFDQLRKGRKPSDIAKELTERGVENPGDYRCRIRGWKLRGNHRGWSEGTVYFVARNEKFAGRWNRIIEGRDYAADCAPIIEPELFDEVQQIFDQRRHHNKKCERRDNPFLKMATDEESGAKVIMKKNQYTGVYEYHFQYPKPSGVDYEKTAMPYDVAVRKVVTILKREKAMALIAADYISSTEGVAYRDSLIDGIKKSCRDHIAELTSPEIDTFEIIDREISEIRRIMLALSTDNPWIKLFLEFDEKQELTRQYLTRFAEHVYFKRFEDIRLCVHEEEWKHMIPLQWMEEQ